MMRNRRRVAPGTSFGRLLTFAFAILLVAGAAFLAGWLVALGAVHHALATLNADIRAVNRHRPLKVTRVNFLPGIVGFVLGMLVVVVGRRLLRPAPPEYTNDPDPSEDGPAGLS